MLRYFDVKGNLMRWMLLAVLLLLVPSTALAQAKNKKPQKSAGSRIAPTFADFVSAHDSERQRLDFCQAKSDKPTPVVLMIHGGGWMGGEKNVYGIGYVEPFLNKGISVAAI